MALYIPPNRKPSQTGRRPANEDEGGSRWKISDEWNDSHIRHELFEGLASGRYGIHLKSQQVEDLKQLINRARGADGVLSPSQALHAIGAIHRDRVKLGLDRATADSIVDLIIQGPQD